MATADPAHTERTARTEQTERLLAHGPATDADVPTYIEALGLPGVIDMHVHFMPASVQRKVWGVFDRATEAGLPPWPVNYRFDDDARLAVLREMGITRFSTLNYAHRPEMAAWLNEYSTRMAAENPDVIHSGTFYPEPTTATVVEESLDAGAQVFKIHVQVGDFTPLDPLLAPAWSQIEDAGVPVVIHAGSGPEKGRFTGPDPVVELAERYPNLVLVIAHMGLPEYHQFARLAAEAPNVYLDTTMVDTDFMNQISPLPADLPETARKLTHKIVLGTDFPTIPYDYHHQLQVLHRWGLGPEFMRAILWDNPARLLNITPTS